MIPADVLSLLRAGRLDKRLFDVTATSAPGDTLPLLVTYAPKGPAAAGTKARSPGTPR